MKNNFKKLIEFVGLSYKRELFKIIAINIVVLALGVLSYFFLKNLIISIVVLMSDAVVDYFLLSRYSDKKKAILKNRENELIAIISYFEVYIQNNNNVYQSFNLLIQSEQ